MTCNLMMDIAFVIYTWVEITTSHHCGGEIFQNIFFTENIVKNLSSTVITDSYFLPCIYIYICSGIKLRERTVPMKYTLDDNMSGSSSDDESGEPFPKERTVMETWINEVCHRVFFIIIKYQHGEDSRKILVWLTA